MTKFDSSLGSHTVKGQAGGRHLTIPDESGSVPGVGRRHSPQGQIGYTPAPQQETGYTPQQIAQMQHAQRQAAMSQVEREQQVRQQYGQNLAPMIDQESLNSLNSRLGIPDDEEEMQKTEREFQEARKERAAKLAGKERMPEGAKKRLMYLLEQSVETRTVSILDTEYVFQTLCSKEQREVAMELIPYDGSIQQLFEARRQLIARSLKKIGGISFEDFIGSKTLEAKLDFLDQLPENILNRLFAEYNTMRERADEKYAIKTSSDVEEIVADLKK
jgi:hypothetical protein